MEGYDCPLPCALSDAFRRGTASEKEIPYTIYSGVSFFGRMEIKDALCYLRMIAYHDDLSFLRISNVPKRNLGERRRKFLQEIAAAQNLSLYEALKQNLEHEIFHNTAAAEFVSLIERFSSDYQNRPVSEVLSAILDESGYECMLRTEGSQERLDNLAELKQSVHEYEVSCGEELTLENYLAHAALFTTSDAAGTGDKVKLMTVHTAKGLEFPCVFLCGMNEGIFPSRKTRTIQGMEEERRLCFCRPDACQRPALSLRCGRAQFRRLTALSVPFSDGYRSVTSYLHGTAVPPAACRCQILHCLKQPFPSVRR